MRGKKLGFLAVLLVIAVMGVFWVKGAISLDPDFGWRIRVGELISAKGIPKTDPFSYTMPNFPFVDHAWLTDVSMAKLYPVISMVSLAAIAAAIVISALIISASKAKISRDLSSKKFFYFASAPFLLAASVVLPFAGVRVQIVTWLMLAILLRVILDPPSYKKRRFVLPFYFALWANLHGGFAAGLAALFIVIIIKTVRQKRIEFADSAILLACLAATLINPYGVGTWREVWSSVSDASLKKQILEWMPSFYMFDFAFPAFFTLSFMLVVRYRDKFSLEEAGLYLAFLTQAILSRRHIPLWVVVGLPMTVSAIFLFYQEIAKDKKAILRFKKAAKFGFFLSLAIFGLQSFFSVRDARFLSEKVFYPAEAVAFLRTKRPEGEIFSRYGWGGYLIWKLPEKKVFIDGRMPSWRWEPKTRELPSAFDTYNDLLRGDIKYSDVFAKYGVDTVLWPVAEQSGFLNILEGRLGDFLARFGKEKSDFNFLGQLSKDGWEKVYEDSVAAIYQKPE